MNVETLNLRGNAVDDRLKFGWQISGTEKQSHTRRHGRHHSHHTVTYTVMTRDKDMQNYALLCALENKYFYLKNQFKTYKPIKPKTAIILFLLLIFPFIIYIRYKSNQKVEITNYNNNVTQEIYQLEEEAKKLF